MIDDLIRRLRIMLRRARSGRMGLDEELIISTAIYAAHRIGREEAEAVARGELVITNEAPTIEDFAAQLGKVDRILRGVEAFAPRENDKLAATIK